MRTPTVSLLQIFSSLTALAIPTAGYAEPAEARSNSAVSHELTIGYSYSPAADLDHNGKIGEAEISQFRFSYTLMAPVEGKIRLLAGVFGTETDLGLSGSVPLPERLRLVGLKVGAVKDLADSLGQGWRAAVMLRPTLSSASSSFSGAGFNLPGALSVGYRQNPTLDWDVGLAVNPRGEYRVLPLIGVRWDLAPQWTASLGFPRTGVAFKASSTLTVRAGADYQGGTYMRGDTWLEYRDIRFGLGLDYQLTGGLTANIDAGLVLDRRFEYLDRNYRIEGGSGSYVTAGLRYRL